MYARGYGHFTWSTASPVPDPDSTLWDVASITKVVSTASIAMRLVDRGKLELEAPVRRYLPRFAGGLKNDVTVRMLLDHTSGLKSYVPFYLKARGSRSRGSTCSTPNLSSVPLATARSTAISTRSSSD